MNIYVLFSLLLFLTPGGCPIYSIDVSTLEVPTDFQNELTLQSMLSSELHQYRNQLNADSNDREVSSMEHFQQARDLDEDRDHHLDEDPFESAELLRSIEDRIKATYYAAASPEGTKHGERSAESEQPRSPQGDVCPNEEATFLGTNLFGGHPKRCFSTEDIALMSARKDFEMLLPKTFPQTLVNDDVIYMLMKFFNSANHVVKRMSEAETRRLVQRAFYDALGGYLRFYLVPVGQVSYYAGRLKLCTVQRLVALYRQCQLVLNTNGNGWRLPEADILAQLKNVHIKPVQINESSSVQSDASSCALLDTSCSEGEPDSDEPMIVQLPHLELEDSFGYLTNIFLPFKNRRIFNLRSPDSAFILVKFFKIVSNCHRFQGVSQKAYNQKLRLWIKESVQMHYRDEMFYPGLGGILQIYEALSVPALRKMGSQSGDDDEQPEQEPVLSEESSKDYDFNPEDIKLADDKKEQAKKGKGKGTKPETSSKKAKGKDKGKEKKEIVPGRKQSRSAEANSSDARLLFYGDPIQLQDDATTEECIDCAADIYMAHIAIIVSGVFVVLLFFVCLCIYCHRKKPTKPPPSSEPPSGGGRGDGGGGGAATANGGANNNSEKPASEPMPSPSSNKEEEWNCWKTLFRSRKQQRGNQFQQFGGMPLKQGFAPSHESYEPRTSAGYIDIEKQMQRKKKNRKYEELTEDTFTSTSSLGFQFKKKFLPIKMGREKREEYYKKADKKHSKAVSKHTSTQNTAQDQGKPLLVAKQRIKERDSEARQGPTKKLYKGKHKRQEGGVWQSQERVEYTERTERTRPSDSHTLDVKGSGTTSVDNDPKSLVLISVEEKSENDKQTQGAVPNTEVKLSGATKSIKADISTVSQQQNALVETAKPAEIVTSLATIACETSNSSWETIYTNDSKLT